MISFPVEQTIRRHLDLLARNDCEGWLRLLLPDALITVDEGCGTYIETPRDHWQRRFGDSWESCVTLMSMVTLDRWAAVSWLQTTLRTYGGIVSLGVDVVELAPDGRINSIRQHVETGRSEFIV